MKNPGPTLRSAARKGIHTGQEIAYCGSVTSNARGEVWYEGDHVEGGFEVLERSGHPRTEVLTDGGTAAPGDHRCSCWVTTNLEILSGDGDLLLDVGDREVRAVRPDLGRFGHPSVHHQHGESGLLPTRWMHRISDADARYLEQCWLDASPFMHPGTQLNRLCWREEGYAYYVGRVVTEASAVTV